VDACGAVLADRGDFWVKNPWRYPMDKNLSAYEPNRLYLNRGEMAFHDATWLSPAGTVSDGRGSITADFDGDLAPDILARNIGGGPVQIFLNRFPPAGRLVVRLRGTRSNRMGVGARISVEAGPLRLMRDLFPSNSHVTQQPCEVDFGLGAAKVIDVLRIRWPSGAVQELHDLPVGRRILIVEGQESHETVGTR